MDNFRRIGYQAILPMQNRLLQKIIAKQGDQNVFEFLSQHLPLSAFNSFLLEVFNQRVKQIGAPRLLRNYCENRFVQPFRFDPISFKEYELQLLKAVRKQGFEIFQASPLAPLGSCSVPATVDQKKIISALRNTEIVADVTNIMALEIARRKKENGHLQDLKLAATHRHVRGQAFDFPGFTPHFSIISLVSAGRDKGNYAFEVNEIIRHVQTYVKLLTQQLPFKREQLSFQCSMMIEGENQVKEKLNKIFTDRIDIEVQQPKIIHPTEKRYYRDFRFAISLTLNENTYEIIDGGGVDWTQQFLQNKKERLMISGMGSEFLYGLMHA